MRYQTRSVGYLFLAAVVAVAGLHRPALAQPPWPVPPQSTVQGAGISGGGTATFAGVTIINRLDGDVTYSLGHEILSITAVRGTPPFTLALGTGAGCELSPPIAATGARCPAPPGTTFILVAAVPTAVAALPRTGTGVQMREPQILTWMLGEVAAVLVVAASSAAFLVTRRRRGPGR